MSRADVDVLIAERDALRAEVAEWRERAQKLQAIAAMKGGGE